MDSSSDISGYSFLAVCARFIDELKQEEPLTKLISLIPLSESSTGASLEKLILEKVLVDSKYNKILWGL
jgi:hypothetical protein